MTPRIWLLPLALIIGMANAAEDRILTVGAASSEKRVALVIGNAAYTSAPLKNPANDAKDMAAALRRLGFDVIEKTNATQKEMNRAIVQFGGKLASSSVALFYYAGHGMQVKGKNYLIPVDAQIEAEASVRVETVDVDGVLDQLGGGALNVVILDACRNNPFERKFRSTGGGLAQMDAPKGTLIAYATAPGRTAADGEGRNGLYTQELLKLIQSPGLPVEAVFKRVRANVAKITGDNQIPWESSSLTGDFYFKSVPTGAGAVVANAPASLPAPDPAAIELAYWDGVKESREAEAFKTYLEQYPDGRFAALARVRMRELTSEVKPALPVAPQRTAATDFLEGVWEYQISNNRAHVQIYWNPKESQYEGMLMKQGEVSLYVGFVVGEIAWKARLTDNPRILKESQLFRTGQNGVTMTTKWMDGEINLDRSTHDELVTAFARLKRVQ